LSLIPIILHSFHPTPFLSLIFPILHPSLSFILAIPCPCVLSCFSYPVSFLFIILVILHFFLLISLAILRPCYPPSLVSRILCLSLILFLSLIHFNPSFPLPFILCYPSSLFSFILLSLYPLSPLSLLSLILITHYHPYPASSVSFVLLLFSPLFPLILFYYPSSLLSFLLHMQPSFFLHFVLYPLRLSLNITLIILHPFHPSLSSILCPLTPPLFLFFPHILFVAFTLHPLSHSPSKNLRSAELVTVSIRYKSCHFLFLTSFRCAALMANAVACTAADFV